MRELLKILIVDDEEMNQEILAEVLKPHYTTLLAKSGKQTIKCVLQLKGQPDLILLDINMPEMDGYEVCRILKANAVTRDIPVIFVTAMDNDVSEAKGLELGAVDYITKPIRVPIVLARVRTHLELSLTHKTLKKQNQQLQEAAQQIRVAAQLRESAKMREEMDRIMRHDLKGPLSAIIAVPGLIEEVGALNGPQKALMQTVEESGYRLLDMINRSLDMHKMELGIYTLRATVVDMLSIVRKVISELQGLSQNKNLTISIQIHGQQSEATKGAFLIVGEELLCHSMLSNLVKNAIESAPENSEISVSLGTTQEDMYIQIHNRGCVPQSIQKSFFEKYSTSGKKNGTGLGTYSAQLIAELHGGNILLDADTDPEGTTLIVQLRMTRKETATN